jgi:hypothetical protein
LGTINNNRAAVAHSLSWSSITYNTDCNTTDPDEYDLAADKVTTFRQSFKLIAVWTLALPHQFLYLNIIE